MKKTILTIIASIFLMVNCVLAQTTGLLPGDLDANFGRNGVFVEKVNIVDTEVNSNNEIVYATQQSIKIYDVNGRFLLYSTSNIKYQGSVIKFSDLSVLTNNSILAVGTVLNFGVNKAVLFKLRPDLQLDNNFGQNGFVIIDQPNFRYSAGSAGNSLIVQPDGRILLIGGRYDKTIQNSQPEQFLIRFESNGNVDWGFGNGGMVTESINKDYTFGLNIGFQGRNIVVSGESRWAIYYLVVYDENGKRQSQFNNGDIMFYASANFVVQSDFKIVYGDWDSFPNTIRGLHRIDIYGNSDPSYLYLSNSGAAAYTRCENLAIDSNDKVYSAYTAFFNNPTEQRALVGLFKTNGTLESGFISSNSQPFLLGINIIDYKYSNRYIPTKLILQDKKLLVVAIDLVYFKALIFKVNGI